MPDKPPLTIQLNLKETLGEEAYRKFRAVADKKQITEKALLLSIAFGIPPHPSTINNDHDLSEISK